MVRICCGFAFLLAATAARGVDWTTPAETAAFATTPDYVDTMAYLRRLADAAPDRLRLQSLGQSPEGREILAVVVASEAVSAQVRARLS